MKNHHSDAYQTEPRSARKVKDQTFEVQRLETDILALQDQLEIKETENKKLEQEVENLKLALVETSDQLMKSNPAQKKVEELQTQLKTKDLIIEQLSNQIGILSAMGGELPQRTKKKTGDSGAKASSISKKTLNASTSDINSADGQSADQSPGLSRLTLQSTRLNQNSASFHTQRSEDSTPIKINSSDKPPQEQQSDPKTNRDAERDRRRSRRSMAMF